MTIPQFKKFVWKFYKEHGRHDLPWRKTTDPYKILVSEIMLQQTQVSRVISKYESFLKKFPTVQKLADAKLSEVLKEWQGLGYNRRGMYLKRCAEEIVKNYRGKFPQTLAELKKLPGIGPTTAADVLAFAWNLSADKAGMPVLSIETNIRAVFIHHFLDDPEKEKQRKKLGQTCAIYDKDVLPWIEKTLDKENPREWYYALMDYGSYVKTQVENPSRKSKHHVKQSKFEGSNRQKRAEILRLILAQPLSAKQIYRFTKYPPLIIEKNLDAMVKEKIVTKKSGRFAVL